MIIKHLHKQLSLHAPDCESLFRPQMIISYFSLPVFILHTYGCHRLYDNRVYQIWRTKFSLPHWLYTQNGLNLFSRWQHSKKMLTKKEIIATSLFVSNIFYYLCTIRVITLKHNNEELRNTNGCYLVTQFSSNPTNRFILSKLSFLTKVT